MKQVLQGYSGGTNEIKTCDVSLSCGNVCETIWELCKNQVLVVSRCLKNTKFNTSWDEWCKVWYFMDFSGKKVQKFEKLIINSIHWTLGMTIALFLCKENL